MSRYIKVTPECKEEIRKEFEETLATSKFPNGKFTYTKNLVQTNEKATIYFDEVAWQKMQSLIREFDTEVAWHGIARRGEDADKNDYYISDIIVYPQIAAGSTVNTDQIAYEQWLMHLSDEEFNNLRMQGHSHVYMGTTPSSVDMEHQDKIFEQLKDDMFYIFMIWNKKKDNSITIYDMLKNTIFETKDISVEVIEDPDGIEQFIHQAKELVQVHTVHIQTSASPKPYNANGISAKANQSAKKTKKAIGKANNTAPYNSQTSLYGDYYDSDYPLEYWK